MNPQQLATYNIKDNVYQRISKLETNLYNTICNKYDNDLLRNINWELRRPIQHDINLAVSMHIENNLNVLSSIRGIPYN